MYLSGLSLSIMVGFGLIVPEIAGSPPSTVYDEYFRLSCDSRSRVPWMIPAV